MIKKNNSTMIQTVTLTFSDGTDAVFTGPAVLFKGTKKITNISFGKPMELPDGCEWSNLEKSNKNHEK